MKQITIQFNIEPFEVPNGVFESIKPMPAPPKHPPGAPRVFQLSELNTDVLYSLCDDFRTEVFEKAGLKVHPAVAESIERPGRRIMELARKLRSNTHEKYLERDECQELADFVLGL